MNFFSSILSLPPSIEQAEGTGYPVCSPHRDESIGTGPAQWNGRT